MELVQESWIGNSIDTMDERVFFFMLQNFMTLYDIKCIP